MKKFFYNLFVAYKDIINAFKFRKEMKNKEKNLDSEFKELGLSVNWLGNVVYTQVNCTDRELVDADYSINDMVMKKLKPYVDYFGKLQWGEYLIPQVSNLQDETGEMTLSFLFLFVYEPIVFTFGKLFKLLLLMGVLGVSVWGIVQYIETFM